MRDPATEPAPDLVNRHFTGDGPDRLWITEHSTEEGKVYCAAVMDAYSRLIVGWPIDSHMRTEFVTDALGMAIMCRKPSSASWTHLPEEAVTGSDDGREQQAHRCSPTDPLAE